MSNKTHISVCTVGTVDAGKSTLAGRLIYELGGIPDRELDKLKQRAAELNKSSFAFAFYMDNQKEEQERGITINVTTKEFFTDKYHYTICDCPGHRDFVKNMVSGSSQVDVALILCPCDGNFTAAISKGSKKEGVPEGQTRAHARLISTLGVKQVVVLANKMDEKSVGYSEARFNEVQNEMRDMLMKVGFKKEQVLNNIPIIPISAWSGDNLTSKSENMSWWNGCEVTNLLGEKVKITTIVDALNNFVCDPPRNLDAPVRVPISGVYNIKGAGTILTGRVEQGVVRPGDEVVFIPTHSVSNACSGKVFSIEMHHRSVEVAGSGDNVGMSIKGLDKNNMPKTGDIMVLKKDTSLKRIKSFSCQVQVIEHPGEIKVGYTPIGCVRTAKSAVKMTTIDWKVGKETGGQKLANPASLKTGEMAQVLFEPQQAFVVEKFTDCEGLGRIAIFEGNSVVMIGKVVDVQFSEEKVETKKK
jgi:elongation factor 1-alpha